MKEKLGVALAATSVLVAGCATESTPPKITEVESVATFPGTLPPAVSQQLGNVVAIQSLRIRPTGPNQIDAMACSGVRIDQRDFLTAGLCDYALTPASQQPHCDVVGVSMSLPAAKPEDPPKGVSYAFEKKDGVAPATDITDIGKMTENSLVGEIRDKVQPLPAYDNPTHYAASPVMTQVGEQLYIANYQKTPDDKKAHNPDINASQLSPEDIKAGLTKPVIMGAIALDQSPNGILRVLTGIKSYGDSNENQLRGGDIGGPVWDADGNLVGTITMDDNTHKLSEFEKTMHMHINLPGLSDDTVANVGVVQLINPPRIKNLQTHLAPVPKC